MAGQAADEAREGMATGGTCSRCRNRSAQTLLPSKKNSWAQPRPAELYSSLDGDGSMAGRASGLHRGGTSHRTPSPLSGKLQPKSFANVEASLRRLAPTNYSAIDLRDEGTHARRQRQSCRIILRSRSITSTERGFAFLNRYSLHVVNARETHGAKRREEFRVR
jgi:hypothetical protein